MCAVTHLQLGGASDLSKGICEGCTALKVTV